MKRAEVGNFRVLLDDRGEGAVVIDHARNDGSDPGKLLVLEPGELDDLLVALDAVQGDLPAPNNVDLQHTIALKGQELLHAIYRFAPHRMRLELHVEGRDFFAVAGAAKIEKIKSGQRLEARIGNVVLVCERGRRV